MYQYMENTKNVITEYGGIVVEMILDEQGTHMGYRLNKEHHEKAINNALFFRSSCLYDCAT